MSDPLFPQGPTLHIQCPMCGLLKPESAIQCACGHHFQTGTAESPSLARTKARQTTKKPNRKQAWVVVKANKTIKWFSPIRTIEDAHAAVKIAYSAALSFAGLSGFYFFLALLAPAFLSGCIPVDQKSQGVNNNFSPSQNLTNGQKLEDLETSFRINTQKWDEKYSKFVQNAEILSQEVNLLTGHSGWTSFLEIIKTYNSLIYVEGTEAAQKKIAVSLSAWDTRWNTDGTKFYQKYVELAGRSQDLEKQRITLWSERDAMYQKFWDDNQKNSSSMMDHVLASNADGTAKLFEVKIILGISEQWRKLKKNQIERDHVARQIYGLNLEDGLFRRKLFREDLEKLLGP